MRDDLAQSLLQWCRDQRCVYARQLELMEAELMWTGERRNGQPVDTTSESIDQVKAIIAEIDELLTKLVRRPN